MKWMKALKVRPGTDPKLEAIDPRQTLGFGSKEEAKAALVDEVEQMAELQRALYAEGRQALLVVFQALDAGGKDGTIRSVFGAVNPQGCRVTSFKVPSAEERAHDYLWRIHRAMPAKGYIGVFNRSHYEDVLVVRVDDLVPKQVWSKRYEEINRFERHLADNGTRILKIYLHISKDEQRERFQERLDDPTKHWKFSAGDLEKRKQWNEYRAAYEDALRRCSTDWAPWYVVPADRNWVRNLAVARIVRTTLEAMAPQYPTPKDFDPTQYEIV